MLIKQIKNKQIEPWKGKEIRSAEPEPKLPDSYKLKSVSQLHLF